MYQWFYRIQWVLSKCFVSHMDLHTSHSKYLSRDDTYKRYGHRNKLKLNEIHVWQYSSEIKIFLSQRYIYIGKIVLVFNSLSAMPWKPMSEWRYSSIILDLGTRRRWVVSFMPRPLYPRGKIPATHPIWGWVGPGAGLDAVEKRNTSYPCRELNPGCPARRHRDWAIPTPGNTLLISSYQMTHLDV
jgi:hypothetical protein